MDQFEEDLRACRGALKRFVRFKISDPADAEDVLQDILIAAYQNRASRRGENGFKAWLMGIARHKCSDYYRRRPRETAVEWRDVYARGPSPARYEAVHDTLSRLTASEQQILRLYYYAELPQAEIAARLGIPPGTVKSRLHYARESFRRLYPCPPATRKGDVLPMKALPETLPPYTIEQINAPPFSVRCEEMPGWVIVPRPGEKISWGLYEMPGRDRTEYTEMEVVGQAEIHGEVGAEIVAVQHDASNYFRTGSVDEMERRFVTQLTATHCRVLAESHVENGVRRLFTFLDGDSFLNNWGCGPDNCGIAVDLRPKGLIRRLGNEVQSGNAPEAIDIVGRYRVTIGGKSYDTVCVMDIMAFNDRVLSEDYLDQNGRTVLWRRFNADDWAFHRYQKPWSEMLPGNERLIVNGKTFVHWYDCVSTYIF